MSKDITNINSKNWQHKRGSIGEIVVENDDIKQCIKSILETAKGEVPLNPEAGTEIINAVDENPDDAVEIAIKTVYKEIPKQEPRCEVLYVESEKDIDTGVIKIIIYFKNKKTNITDKTEVYIK